LKKTKQEAEVTKQAILQSALDLFYEKGYSKTTFELISARIGLTKGAVYWYFKNKPVLVAALINDYVLKKTAYLKKKVPVLKHFSDVERYFSAAADFIIKDENAQKLAFFLALQMEWSQSIITKVTEEIKQSTETSFAYVSGALQMMQKKGEIRDDLSPDLLTSVIFNLWTGHLEAYFSKRCATDLKTMVRKSFDLLFNGLIKKG